MSKIPYLGMSTLLCMPLVLQGCAAPSSTGTATRPLLTAQEAAPYTTKNYFAQGGLFSQPQGPWQPSEITLTHIETPWRVAPEGAPYTRVQQAVNKFFELETKVKTFGRTLIGTVSRICEAKCHSLRRERLRLM